MKNLVLPWIALALAGGLVLADFFPWPWLLLVFSFIGAAGAVFFLGSRKKVF